MENLSVTVKFAWKIGLAGGTYLHLRIYSVIAGGHHTEVLKSGVITKQTQLKPYYIMYI